MERYIDMEISTLIPPILSELMDIAVHDIRDMGIVDLIKVASNYINYDDKQGLFDLIGGWSTAVYVFGIRRAIMRTCLEWADPDKKMLLTKK